jgi:hypothetical protein
MSDKWLQWASELQSIAQAGLTFSSDRYDLDRYEKILMVKEKVDGAWSLPGGWVYINNSLNYKGSQSKAQSNTKGKSDN